MALIDVLAHAAIGGLVVLPAARFAPVWALVLVAALCGLARELEQMLTAGDASLGSNRLVDVAGFALGALMVGLVVVRRRRNIRRIA